MIIKKGSLQLLSIIVTLLIVFAGIIAYSVTASNKIEQVDQKVNSNKENIDSQLTLIRTDIIEIKTDIKTLLSKAK